MNSLNKTVFSPKNYKSRNWFIIDCTNQKLGRIATFITSLLKGKTKPNYFPSIDNGDYVILINAELIILNEEKKHYIVNHPGRPGNSLKIKKASDCLPSYIIQSAVKGMLSEKETKRLMKRLIIYNKKDHLHHAQKPIQLDLSI